MGVFPGGDFVAQDFVLFGSVTIIVRNLEITSTITGEEGAKEKVEDVENAGES